MPTRVAHSAARAVVVGAVLVAACVAVPAQQPGPDALATSVTKFLDTWLVAGNSNAAVSMYLAPIARDERFVPAQFYKREEYRRLQSLTDSAPQLTLAEASNRFATVLTRMRLPDAPKSTSLQEVLAPVDEKAVPELWSGLKALDITPRVLPGVAALAFPLRNMDSYEWVGSETVAYRVVIPQLLTKGLPIQGVVNRVREKGLRKPWMLFTFWSQEGTGATVNWKLLGLSPVPTE